MRKLMTLTFLPEMVQVSRTREMEVLKKGEMEVPKKRELEASRKRNDWVHWT